MKRNVFSFLLFGFSLLVASVDDAKTYTFNVPVGSLKANLDYKVV